MQVTHTIEETGHEVLFVGLPYNHVKVNLYKVIDKYLQTHTKEGDGWKQHNIGLPKGDWQLLGTLDQIKDEDLEGVMPSRIEDGYGVKLKLYYDFNENHFSYCAFVYDTAKESLLSLMQMLKLYTVNPYGEKPKFKGAFVHDGFENDRDREEKDEYRKELLQWQEAQSRTFKQVIVLVRPINK